MECNGTGLLYPRCLTAGASTWSLLYCLYKGCADQNDPIPKNPESCALVVYIAGDTSRHHPMGVGHMTVLQLHGPMGFHVLQWCHPMLACANRTSYCTRIITLYCAWKVDSGPRTEDNRKMLHKEYKKEKYNVKIYVTGKLQQWNTTQRYRTEKMEKKQDKDVYLTGKVPQPRTTERFRTERLKRNSTRSRFIPHARFQNRRQQKSFAQKDWKETPQGQVFHRQGSTTEDNRKVSQREDRKETPQGQVFHRQGSTTQDNTKIAKREDRKQTAQGRVSKGHRSTTEDNRKVSHREDGK